MDIAITKRQALALCFHVQAHQLGSIGDIVTRNDTWKALGIDSLASAVAEAARNPRIGIGLEWLETEAFVSGALTDAQVKFLSAHIEQGPFDGSSADHLLAIHEKLRAK